MCQKIYITGTNEGEIQEWDERLLVGYSMQLQQSKKEKK